MDENKATEAVIFIVALLALGAIVGWITGEWRDSLLLCGLYGIVYRLVLL